MSTPERERSAKPREQKRLEREDGRAKRGNGQAPAWARELQEQPGSERRPAKASERTAGAQRG